MALLSPGVQIVEIDASAIVPTVSNSVAVFGGSFERGPVGKYSLITNESELVNFYGKPKTWNYNDFFQCSNFLKYGNSLLVSRAANTNGAGTAISGITVTSLTAIGATTIVVGSTTGLIVGQLVSFGTDTINYYRVETISAGVSFTIDRGLVVAVTASSPVNAFDISMNATFEAIDTLGTAVVESAYIGKLDVIGSFDEFETMYDSIAFADSVAGKFKFIARNPGIWGNSIKIAIAKPSDFGTVIPSYAFDGIGLDGLFDYAPTGNQLCIIIEENGSIVEKFTVSTDPLEKDFNNKSIYIENVINSNSNYLFVKNNTANLDAIKSYLFSSNGVAGALATLILGTNGTTGTDDIIASYALFDNTEMVDVDIVIGNENHITAAVNLADTRKDCIAFLGSPYADVVGKKATDAISAIVTSRLTGTFNINSMFTCFTGNYVYQYDRYNDVNRWVNLAGHVAGLRAQTSTNRASWFASAGLERGQLQSVIKLAYSPNQSQRDMLYKNNINPVVSFPGQGIVMWGQKTLLNKASSFDRVNVRGLFNTLERSLGKMAKYQVMEFNDNFTRNRIVSMIKPFLSSVKSGRGISDYLVVCDLTNNTPDVISRNELVVDIFIKPNYAAEFIVLRFTNAGTNSFSTVTGG